MVRDGELPAGADEAVAEAGGARWCGMAREGGGRGLLDAASRVWYCEPGPGSPGALAGALAQVLAGVPLVLLPASPDGRDLAPRLAALLGRPLLAGAVPWSRAGLVTRSSWPGSTIGCRCGWRWTGRWW